MNMEQRVIASGGQLPGRAALIKVMALAGIAAVGGQSVFTSLLKPAHQPLPSADPEAPINRLRAIPLPTFGSAPIVAKAAISNSTAPKAAMTRSRGLAMLSLPTSTTPSTKIVQPSALAPLPGYPDPMPHVNPVELEDTAADFTPGASQEELAAGAGSVTAEAHAKVPAQENGVGEGGASLLATSSLEVASTDPVGIPERSAPLPASEPVMEAVTAGAAAEAPQPRSRRVEPAGTLALDAPASVPLPDDAASAAPAPCQETRDACASPEFNVAPRRVTQAALQELARMAARVAPGDSARQVQMAQGTYDPTLRNQIPEPAF